MSWGFYLRGLIIKNINFFIDGFNVYHALDADKKYWKYKWLNYNKLAKCFIRKKDVLNKVYYFTALTTWNLDKLKKHKLYIRALRNENVEIVHGKFKKRDKYCPNCKTYFKSREEKKTDVNIAIKLFQDAMNDEFDTAFIISGDSDLIPSIEAIKSSFPSKEIGIVIPINRPAYDLKNTADFHMKMKEKHLSSSLFDDEIALKDGYIIKKPSTWL